MALPRAEKAHISTWPSHSCFLVGSLRISVPSYLTAVKNNSWGLPGLETIWPLCGTYMLPPL